MAYTKRLFQASVGMMNTAAAFLAHNYSSVFDEPSMVNPSKVVPEGVLAALPFGRVPAPVGSVPGSRASHQATFGVSPLRASIPHVFAPLGAARFACLWAWRPDQSRAGARLRALAARLPCGVIASVGPLCRLS